MIVECTDNEMQKLSKDLQEFAFTQSSDGPMDITVGKRYVVYGTRLNQYGDFYLILTDTLNKKLPWWMPASLFKIIDDKQPGSWQTFTWSGYGEETIHADSIYFDAQEDIEDGTPRGHEVFAAMRKAAEEVNN